MSVSIVGISSRMCATAEYRLCVAGQKMTELVPGTSDGAVEKHVPAVETDGRAVTVKVGEVEHPMMEQRLYSVDCPETKEGVQIKHLTPEMKPVAEFALSANDEAVGDMNSAIFTASGRKRSNMTLGAGEAWLRFPAFFIDGGDLYAERAGYRHMRRPVRKGRKTDENNRDDRRNELGEYGSLLSDHKRDGGKRAGWAPFCKNPAVQRRFR